MLRDEHGIVGSVQVQVQQHKVAQQNQSVLPLETTVGCPEIGVRGLKHD